MGELIDLNSSIPAARIDPAMASDAEVTSVINSHLAATDPHLQYATQVRGDLRYFRKYSQAFKAAPNISQTLIVNSPVKILFNSTISNIGNQFTNSRLTALSVETWQFSCYLTFEVTGRIILYLYKNGVPIQRLRDLTATGGFSGQVVISTPVSLVATDFIEFWVTAYTANSKVYGDATLDSSWAEGWRLGD